MTPHISTRARPLIRPSRLRCPYCHDQLGARRLRCCPSCKAEHHADCFKLHGGCAVYGCNPRRDRFANFYAFEIDDPGRSWAETLGIVLWLCFLCVCLIGAYIFMSGLEERMVSQSPLDVILLGSFR